MDQVPDLLPSGHRAYQQGNLGEAESFFRLAAQAAIDNGDPTNQHKALFWEGNCIYQRGEIQLALSRFLEVRLLEQNRPDIDFDTRVAWWARLYSFGCQLKNPTTLSDIEESLLVLQYYSRNDPVASHDMLIVRAIICRQRGMWSDAVSNYETALASPSLLSLHKSGSCRSATHCLLRLRRFDAARDWIAASITDVDSSSQEWKRLIQDLQLFELVRAEGDQSAMRRHLDGIMSAPAYLDEFKGEARTARAWGAFLDSEAGDPAARDHPARRALSRGPRTRTDLTALFKYAVLVLDYRLACLRHAMSLPPNDDEWHLAELPASPPPSERSEANRRLSRARIAASGALRRAVRLDSVFECDWRQEDVNKRIRAIEAISSALDESPHSPKSSGTAPERAV